MKFSHAFASFLTVFAVGLPACANPSVAASASDDLPSATLIPSRDVVSVASAVAPLSVAPLHAKQNARAKTSPVLSRRVAISSSRPPQRFSAPNVATRNAATRGEQGSVQNADSTASSSTRSSSTRLAAAPAKQANSVTVPDAVSDEAVRNYVAMTKTSQPGQSTTFATGAQTSVKTANPAPLTAIKPLTTSKITTQQANVVSSTAASKSVATIGNALTTTKTGALAPRANAVKPDVAAPSVVSNVSPRRDPAILSSRHKDRILLAQLEADLMRANRGLDRADATLSKGQKQLMSVGTTLRRAMLDAGSDSKGLNPFVRVAMRYAGTPYVWGGESRNGFDCSGFIIVVMRDLGYRALPHSAAEQFNYGTPIAQELLKPGDIVFFKNTYKRGVSHVGIYLGRRRFINAAGTGKGTIVSGLDDPYWAEHYAGARRLIRN